MNTVNYLCHTDGSPYTEREMKLDAERATQRAAQNYTHYSDSKNRERTADALESIADSLIEHNDLWKDLDKPVNDAE